MKVECVYKHQNFWFMGNKSPAGHACRVQKLTELDKDGIELIGAHQEEVARRDVVGVSIQNMPHLKKFPRGFGKIFPSLRYMQVLRCSITELTKEDLADLGGLQGLWLDENFIVELSNDLFADVQGLQYLSFKKNQLKYVGADVLTPLKSLKHANFTENTCINVNYNEKPEELLKLKEEIAIKCAFTNRVDQLLVNNSTSLQDLLIRMKRMEEEIEKLKADAISKNIRIKELERFRSC